MSQDLNKDLQFNIAGSAGTELLKLIENLDKFAKGLTNTVNSLSTVDAQLGQNLKKVQTYISGIDAANRLSLATIKAANNATPQALAQGKSAIQIAEDKRLIQSQRDAKQINYTDKTHQFRTRDFKTADKRGELDIIAKAIETRYARAKAEANSNDEQSLKNLKKHTQERKLFVAFQAEQVQLERQRRLDAQAQARKEQALINKANSLMTPEGQRGQIMSHTLGSFMQQPYARKAMSLSEQAKYTKVTNSARDLKQVENMMLSNDLFKVKKVSSYQKEMTSGQVNSRLAEARIQKQALLNTQGIAAATGEETKEKRATASLNRLEKEINFLNAYNRGLQVADRLGNTLLQNQKEQAKVLAAKQALEKTNYQSMRNIDSKSTISGLSTTGEVSAKQLIIKKELKAAEDAAKLAKSAGDAKAITDTSKLVSMYNEELRLLKEKTNEINKQAREAEKLKTAPGQLGRIKEIALINQLNSPNGRNVLTQNEVNKYTNMASKQAQLDRIKYRASQRDVYDTKTASQYGTNTTLNGASSRLTDAAEQAKALKYLKEKALVENDTSGYNKAQAALQLLKEETAFLQRVVGLLRQEQDLNNPIIAAQREKLAIAQAQAKLIAMQPQNFRTTSQVGDIQQIKTASDLEVKRLMIQNEMNKAKKAFELANQSGNTTAAKDIEKIIKMHQEELGAIKGVNRELSRQEQLRDRLKMLFSAEGMGGLLAIQALISRNYSLLNGFTTMISGSYKFLKDFEEALKKTQAISQATTTQMESLKKGILEVSNNSRFGAVELAEATTILAQAGFSLSDIEASLSSVALLATATGSTLAETVDIATSVMGAFQMSASSMPTVVNQITQAMNLSKLDIKKFQLAVQYAGNAAADAGLSFQEMLSSVAAVSNTGVRSGSTLGTGFRQLLADMVAPSEKFNAALKKLGLTAADVDVRTEGLVGAIRNLKEAGFSTMDAYDSFEVRAVAFYTALSNNLTTYDALTQSMGNNTAASEANEVQMNSLAAQSDRMSNQFKVLAEVIGGETRQSLTDFFRLVADITTSLSGALATSTTGTAVKYALLGTVIAGVTAVSILAVRTLIGLTVVLNSLGVTAVKAGASVTLLGRALLILQSSTFIMLALTAAVTAAIYFWNKFSESARAAATELERTKTILGDTKDRISTLGNAMTETDNKIQSLTARFNNLSESPAEVTREFAILQAKAIEMGVVLDTKLTNSVDGLRQGWQELRLELAKKLEVDVSSLEAAIAAAQRARLIKYQETDAKTGPSNFIDSYLNSLRDPNSNFYDPYTGKESNKSRFIGLTANKSEDINYPSTNENNSGYKGFVRAAAEARKLKLNSPEIVQLNKDFEDFLAIARDPLSFSENNKEAIDKTTPMVARINKAAQDIQKAIDVISNLKGITPEKKQMLINTSKALQDVLTTDEIGVNSRRSLLIASASSVIEQNQAAVMTAESAEDTLIQTKLKNSYYADSKYSASQLARINDPRIKTPTLDPKAAKDFPTYEQWFQEYGAKSGVGADLLKAIALTENGGKNIGSSGAGASGLMQFMPATADRFKLKDRTDPKESIRAASEYMKILLKMFNGDLELALAGYNAGEGRVQKAGNKVPNITETKEYVTKVLKAKVKLEGGTPANYVESYNSGQKFTEVDKVRNILTNMEAERATLQAQLDEALGKNGDADPTTEIKTLQGKVVALVKVMAEQQASLSQLANNAKLKLTPGKEYDEVELSNEIIRMETEVLSLKSQLTDLKPEDYASKIKPIYDRIDVLEKAKSEAKFTMEKSKASTFLAGSTIGTITNQQEQTLELNRQRELTQALDMNNRARINAEKSHNEYLEKVYVDRAKLEAKKLKDEADNLKAARDLEEQRENFRIIILDNKARRSLEELKARRANMDDPNVRGNYSATQRQTMDDQIAEEEAAFQRVKAYDDAVTKRLRLEQQVEQDSAKWYEQEQGLKGLKDEADSQLKRANGLETDPRYEAAKSRYDETVKSMQTLEKSTLEARAAMQELDKVIYANSDEALERPFSIVESLAAKARKDAKDIALDSTKSDQAQGMMDSITGSFRSFIDTAASASDSLDDFFSMITGGSHESAEAFRALGRDMLQTIYKVVMDNLTKKFLDIAMNGMNPGQTTGQGFLGTLLGAVAPAALGAVGGTAAGVQASGATTFALGASSGAITSAPLPRFAGGGIINGRDSVMVNAMPKEGILPASSMEVIGSNYFEQLRSNPKAAIQGKFETSHPQPQAKQTTNVYVVSPDNIPSTLSENDVVAHVTSNIQKNGTLKNLVKQVVNGG